jgi:hypothetical protein
MPSPAHRSTGARRRQAGRIAEGIEDILASAKLRRVPAVFVTGRENLAVRNYNGILQRVELSFGR